MINIKEAVENEASRILKKQSLHKLLTKEDKETVAVDLAIYGNAFVKLGMKNGRVIVEELYDPATVVIRK